MLHTSSGLDRIAWEILDSMADDCENLEQVYRSVCYEMHPIAGRTGVNDYDYRPRDNAPNLFEVVEYLRELLNGGFVKPLMDEEGRPWTDAIDPSVLWRAWFTMTPSGRAAWDVSPFNAES